MKQQVPRQLSGTKGHNEGSRISISSTWGEKVFVERLFHDDANGVFPYVHCCCYLSFRAPEIYTPLLSFPRHELTICNVASTPCVIWRRISSFSILFQTSLNLLTKKKKMNKIYRSSRPATVLFPK